MYECILYVTTVFSLLCEMIKTIIVIAVNAISLYCSDNNTFILPIVRLLPFFGIIPLQSCADTRLQTVPGLSVTQLYCFNSVLNGMPGQDCPDSTWAVGNTALLLQ